MKTKKKTRVLIAEDDYFVSGKIEESLEQAGYEVAGTAVDGNEAVRMTEEIRPDVVLMDIRMPHKDGLEATREIQEKCPTPVVALSSYEDEELVNKASEAGVAAYLVKPAESTEIDRAIMVAMARFDDLMESRRLYKALRNSEMRFQRIVEKSEAGYFRLDRDGIRIEFVNSAFAQIHGYDSPVEMKGMPFANTIGNPDGNRASKMIEEILRGKSVPTEEFRHLRKDGSTGYYSISASPVSQYGDIVGIEGFVIDITQRKLAEAERRRLENEMQNIQRQESLAMMAGGIAHDFNNMLMGVLGNADLLLMDMNVNDERRELVLEIEKTARRAAELSGLMLAYSGHGRFLVEETSLSDQIEEAAMMANIDVPEYIEVITDLNPRVTPIRADNTQIGQVYLHILNNAVEAIGKKRGRIVVSVDEMEASTEYLENTYINDGLPAGKYAYLEISDTGCGMNAEARRKICDPFFTTKFVGRGLGMAAVLGIIRGHKGALKVESRPGEGSRIRVLFPVQKKKGEGVKHTEIAPEEWKGSGLILLVDDESAVLNVGRRMLERIGFSVVTAEGGKEAVALYDELKDRIRCVLLDMTMPHMNGEDVFREIRKIRKDACVILTSGYNQDEIKKKFRARGLAGFIQKPYQSAKLVKTLKEIL